MKIRFPRNAPVLIEWVDSGGTASWTNEEHLPPPINIRQLGFFIRANKEGIWLAQGLTDDAIMPDNILAPSFIPGGCIKRIKRIRVPQ